MKMDTLKFSKSKGWSKPIDSSFNSSNTLALVFGDAESFLQSKVSSIFSETQLLGCSSAGNILNYDIFDSDLTVGLIQFQNTRLMLQSFQIEQSNSYNTGLNIAKTMQAHDLKTVFILCEGININGSQIVQGINDNLPKEIVVTGGLAGNGTLFKNTVTYCKDKVLEDYVVAIGFYGDALDVFHGSYGGWDFFGPERVITAAKNNILYELDGMPALDLYKQYLGEKSKELPGSGLLFPLQIRSNSADEALVVRTILAVDEKNKSLTFAGDVPKGYLARMMSAHFDRIIDGAAVATQQMEIKNTSHEVFCVAISCVGRRLILGERAIEEVAAVHENLPKESHLLGFYSYGEISPTQKGTSCALHNQSMTLTVFDEK